MVRYKNRYFLIEINVSGKSRDTPLALKPFSFHNSVTNKVQQLHGDYGLAAIKSGFITKYCNEKTKIALIKVRHGPHKILASSLPFIDRLENNVVSLVTLYVGATMKQCFKFLLNFQRKHLNKTWGSLKTDVERKAYEAALIGFNIEDDIELT